MRAMKANMRMLATMIAVAALTSVSAQTPHATEFKAPPPRFTDPDRRAKLATAFPDIDRAMQEFVTRIHVPGAAWGIVVDGELAHAGAAGFRDVASKSPAD